MLGALLQGDDTPFGGRRWETNVTRTSDSAHSRRGRNLETGRQQELAPAQDSSMHDDLFQQLQQSVIDGAAQQARSLAQQVLAENVDPLKAINLGYTPGLQQVGEQFAKGAVYLPDMIMASEAMKAAVGVLEPELQRRGAQRTILGKVVLGTTKGDIHEIGKNLVGIMLAANSFQVFDLGTNVTPEAFAAKAQEVGADIVGISALLTTTMKGQKSVVEHFRREGSLVKVMVGGAPASRRWAEEIGADGYAKDASAAVELAKSLVSGQPHGEEAAVASLVARSQ